LSSADYQQTAPAEWRWRDDTRQRSVRLFASTRRLIWSAWVETSEGPVFDDGIAQDVDLFLQTGAPLGINVPPDLIALLRRKIDPAGGRSGRRGRFCNG
jgi:hypothetical protein